MGDFLVYILHIFSTVRHITLTTKEGKKMRFKKKTYLYSKTMFSV